MLSFRSAEQPVHIVRGIFSYADRFQSALIGIAMFGIDLLPPNMNFIGPSAAMNVLERNFVRAKLSKLTQFE